MGRFNRASHYGRSEVLVGTAEIKSPTLLPIENVVRLASADDNTGSPDPSWQALQRLLLKPQHQPSCRAFVE